MPYTITGTLKDLNVMRECDLVYVAHPWFAILFCAHLLLSLALTILLYAYIFREAWRQNRQHLTTERKTTLMMVGREYLAISLTSIFRWVAELFMENRP